MSEKAKIPANDWAPFFKEECHKPYFSQLNKMIGDEYARYTVYPPIDKVFNAFTQTPYSKVKAVILGQDPYHEPGQAMGMCFSVPDGVELPPSLVNIYQELSDDLGIAPSKSGDLTSWAKQGVLLLNATLTVRRGVANSHSRYGWQTFTDAVISYVDKKEEPVVYLLWGSFAQSKIALLHNKEHLILKAPHPSPLSAYRGFFGCRHFSQANAYFEKHNLSPIDWKIEP